MSQRPSSVFSMCMRLYGSHIPNANNQATLRRQMQETSLFYQLAPLPQKSKKNKYITDDSMVIMNAASSNGGGGNQQGSEPQPTQHIMVVSADDVGDDESPLDGSRVVVGMGSVIGTANISGCVSGASDDDDDGCASSPGSAYDDDDAGCSDLMSAAMGDEVTAQLAAAGPVGVAAAAAICSSKKRKRPHSFETNPSIRKRQQNRLLRKLRQTIDEFATRVGQQAIVLVATPGKPNTSYKVFGAKPLEDVIKSLRSMIMEELDSALAHQAPPPVQDDPTLFELPPLIIDGIPTPVEKMTQAQLRAFIPLMLKYSTGRGKPGWGRESTRPPWWPKELPWANVRMDARSEDDKQKISWTHALRQIVINCYKFHGREDLLPAFSEEDEKANAAATANANISAQYAPTVLHTITNPDGTVSIVHVDPNNPIITLPDGTTAHVQGMATLATAGGAGQTDATTATLQAITDGQTAEVVDLNSVTEATLNSEGQIILTGEDGHEIYIVFQ